MKKTVVLRLFLLAVMVFYGTGFAQTPKINRSELVRRHNPELDRVDFLSPFTVGNSEFAFTADVTGLQSFPDEYYANGMPLETLSNWAWHSMPNPDGFQLKDANEFVDTHGRRIEYPTQQNTPAGKWLRANPHRMPLGQIGFPYSYDLSVKNKPPLNWNHPGFHATKAILQKGSRVLFSRTVDSIYYFAAVSWSGNGQVETVGPHGFQFVPGKAQSRFEWTIRFSRQTPSVKNPGFRTSASSASAFWKRFWLSGGVIYFSGSTDPRAKELERQIVLSQYLTRIQSAGSLPPQESGLTHISWFGKHHTEMTWWHTAHFALWGRPELLENSFSWFQKILPATLQTTRQERKCAGARWSKMVGPEGRESPGGNPFIIWNRPSIWLLSPIGKKTDGSTCSVLRSGWPRRFMNRERRRIQPSNYPIGLSA